MAEQLLLRARQGEGPRRHVGWYLFREPLGRPAHTARGTGYLAAVTLPTLFLVLLAGFTLHTPLVVALLLLPVSDLVKNSVDFLAVRLFRPRYVYRLDLRDGVPAEGKTLCVIASLLTGEESGRELAGLLERYCLANRGAGEQLLFGMLADLPDSGSLLLISNNDKLNLSQLGFCQLSQLCKSLSVVDSHVRKNLSVHLHAGLL